MNSCEFVTFISAVACSLTKCCSKDELALLAAVFSQLGDTLATILTREEICCKGDDMDRGSKGEGGTKDRGSKSEGGTNTVKGQGGDSAGTQKVKTSGGKSGRGKDSGSRL